MQPKHLALPNEDHNYLRTPSEHFCVMRIKLIVIVFLILMEEPRIMMEVASAGWLGFFLNKIRICQKSSYSLLSPIPPPFTFQVEMN